MEYTNGENSKSRWEKWSHLFIYHISSQILGHQNVKNGSFFVFFADESSHSFGKIFKCIWKILLNPFRKCYGLLGSELPLARFQSLKIQDFGIFYWLNSYFDIHTLNISRTVTQKSNNHTIFWKNSRRSFRYILKVH